MAVHNNSLFLPTFELRSDLYQYIISLLPLNDRTLQRIEKFNFRIQQLESMDSRVPSYRLREDFLKALPVVLNNLSEKDRTANFDFYEDIFICIDHFNDENALDFQPKQHEDTIPVELIPLIIKMISYKMLELCPKSEWEKLAYPIQYFHLFTKDTYVDMKKNPAELPTWILRIALIIERGFGKKLEDFPQASLQQKCLFPIMHLLDAKPDCVDPLIQAYIYLMDVIHCYFSNDEIEESDLETTLIRRLAKFCDSSEEILEFTESVARFIPTLISLNELEEIILKLHNLKNQKTRKYFTSSILKFVNELQKPISASHVISWCLKIERDTFSNIFKKYINLDRSIGLWTPHPSSNKDEIDFYDLPNTLNYLTAQINEPSWTHQSPFDGVVYNLNFDLLREKREFFTIDDLPRNIGRASLIQLEEIYKNIVKRIDSSPELKDYLYSVVPSTIDFFKEKEVIKRAFETTGDLNTKIECTTYYLFVIINAILKAPQQITKKNFLSTQEEMLLGLIAFIDKPNHSAIRDAITQYYYQLPLIYRLRKVLPKGKIEYFVLQSLQAALETSLEEFTNIKYPNQCKFSAYKMAIKNYSFIKTGMIHSFYTYSNLTFKYNTDLQFRKDAEEFANQIPVKTILTLMKRDLNELASDPNLSSLLSKMDILHHSSTPFNDQYALTLLKTTGFLKKNKSLTKKLKITEQSDFQKKSNL